MSWPINITMENIKTLIDGAPTQSTNGPPIKVNIMFAITMQKQQIVLALINIIIGIQHFQEKKIIIAHKQLDHALCIMIQQI